MTEALPELVRRWERRWERRQDRFRDPHAYLLRVTTAGT